MSGIPSFLKKILLPSDEWNLDIDLRYLPVCRFVTKHAPDASVLEIGSSSFGITPYLKRTIVGTDTSFPQPIAEKLLPVVSRGPLPFRNSSFDVVLSLDTLEHVPRTDRQLLINEAIRVARKYVIIGFPEGEDAEQHDSEMEHYYLKVQGEVHPYFVEHRTYRIPRKEESGLYLDVARRQIGKEFTVERIKNVNIFLRSLFIRLIWHPRRSVRAIYFLLTMFSRWDGLFHFGVCYRSIYFLTLDSKTHV